MKSLWNGSIEFVQLKIGIKIYPAIGDSNIEFRLLHTDCHTPINMKKWCRECQVELKQEDLTRGYEIDKENFILISEEEYESLSSDENKTIKISECVNANAISLIANKGDFYYIGAERGFERACMLLSESLKSTHSCLVGKWIHHNKEHDIIIVPYNKQLMISVLRYNEEINNMNEIYSIADRDVPTDEEIQLGIELIRKVSKRKFNLPESNSFNKKFSKLMGEKTKQMLIESIKEAGTGEEGSKGLMNQIQQSLDEVRTDENKDIEKG